MSQLNLPAQTIQRLRCTATRLLSQKGAIQINATDLHSQHVHLVTHLKRHQDILKEHENIPNQADSSPKRKRSAERATTLPVRRYKKYTSEFKQKVVKQLREELAQSGKSLSRCISQKAKAYELPMKNVRRWLEIKNFNALTYSYGRKVRFPSLEQKLESEILVNPSMNRGQILALARRLLNADNSVSEQKKSKFAFSNGWYQKFRLRHRSLFERKVRLWREKEEVYFDNTISDMLQV